MTCRVQVRPIRRVRYLCTCGRPAHYTASNGKERGRRDHELCAACFAAVMAAVRRAS